MDMKYKNFSIVEMEDLSMKKNCSKKTLFLMKILGIFGVINLLLLFVPRMLPSVFGGHEMLMYGLLGGSLIINCVIGIVTLGFALGDIENNKE